MTPQHWCWIAALAQAAGDRAIAGLYIAFATDVIVEADEDDCDIDDLRVC